MRKRIAIVGSGYSAVGVAYHLRRLHDADITVIDKCKPGAGGASAASAGLIHPITPQGKMSWRGEDAYTAAVEIMAYTSTLTCNPLVYQHYDIKCPFFGDSKTKYLERAAHNHPEWVALMDDAAVNAYNQNAGTSSSVIAILKGGKVVDSNLYMRLFWSLMESKFKFKFIEQAVERIEDIAQYYDIVIVAAGAGLLPLWNEKLPLTLIRGRNVMYDTRNISVPDFGAILCGKYAIHQPHKHEIICGSSYEYITSSADTSSCEGDILGALELMEAKIVEMLPSLKKIVPSRCSVGVRVATHDAMINGVPKVPLVLKHSDLKNVWAITGMGSKGLLYHGIIGKYTAKAALEDNIEQIPNELRLGAATL